LPSLIAPSGKVILNEIAENSITSGEKIISIV
jgi:hypothetical protein